MDFGMPYYTPMDKSYHSDIQHTDRRSDIEQQSLFSINQIGQTVPEVDPSGRNRSVIENVEAAIKGGAGNVQIVMSVVGQTSGMGGGPKAYGEDVREAIRDVQRVSGAKITGVELPTQISNLSGFSQQGFSEQQRKTALEEVKDSIKFIGDIAGGGGVDVLSWEFPRNFSDAKWFNKKEGFEQKGEEIPAIVDTQTGNIQQFHPKQKFYMYKKPGTNEDTPGKPQEWLWKDFKILAEKEGKRAEDVFVKEYLQKQEERQIKHQESTLTYYSDMYAEQIEGWKRQLEDKNIPEEYKKRIKENIKRVNERLETEKEQLTMLELEKKRIEDYKTRYQPVDTFGLQKAAQSYGEAGIWAMQESQKNQYVQHGKGSIYVGPEIGWPQFYGSHPKEWVELIKTSRDEMSRQLTDKSSPYFDSSISKQQAEKIAREHIKGEVDTSHIGMWLQNFKPELPWDKRVSEFKNWFKDQMEYLAEENKKYDLIGGVQIVDSASGAHGHLPPGQGILGKDIYEYMKILKEKGGYKGELTSEGHEEERMGQGRILTKAWETFGVPIGSNYWHGRAMPQFRDIRNSYANIAYGTTGIFQSYVPSNDFQLWSQVPLE